MFFQPESGEKKGSFDQEREPFSLKVVALLTELVARLDVIRSGTRGRPPVSDLSFAVWNAAFRPSGLFPPPPLGFDFVSVPRGGWRAVGSGANTGGPSAAVTVDAGLLSEIFLPRPSRRGRTPSPVP